MRVRPIPGPRDVRVAVERAGDLLEQLVTALPRLAGVLAACELLVVEVQALVERIEETRVEAEQAVADARAPLARLVAVLDLVEPPLQRLRPTLARLAETTDPHEVEALVALVDRLPTLADKVDHDVLPVLETLSSVAPDMHDLLEVSRELNEMLARLPGMGRIKRQVEEDETA